MPVGLLGLHLYFRDRRTRWLALFGLSCLLQGLSSGYYLLFFPVLIGLWLLWFRPAAKTERWNTLAAVGGAWALAMLPLVPLLLQYRGVHDRFGLAMVPQQVVPIQAESADGGHGFETGVRSVPIVAVEPGCEVLGALG